MGQAPDEIREQIEQTRDQMSETAAAIGYKTDVPSRAKDSIANKKDKLMGTLSEQKEKVTTAIAGGAQQAGSNASGAASTAADGAKQAVGLAQENPLGLGVGAVAVGFLLGLMVPATRIENERIGPVADQLKDKAREAGEEAVSHGREVAKEVAQSAVETARDSAQEHGQQMSSSVQEKADDIRPS